MNSKKHKNKNKHNKPPNPVPPQKNVCPPKQTELVEKVEDPKQDSAVIDEAKVELKVCETSVIDDVKESVSNENSPCVPKRKKNKRKNNDAKVNDNIKKDDEEVNINVDAIVEHVYEEIDTPKQPNDEEKHAECESKVVDVAPTSRKKKNKKKKNNQDFGDSKITSDVETIEIEKQTEDIDKEVPQNDRPLEQEATSSKKKNKNKKNKQEIKKQIESSDTQQKQSILSNTLDDTIQSTKDNDTDNEIKNDDKVDVDGNSKQPEVFTEDKNNALAAQILESKNSKKKNKNKKGHEKPINEKDTKHESKIDAKSDLKNETNTLLSLKNQVEPSDVSKSVDLKIPHDTDSVIQNDKLESVTLADTSNNNNQAAEQNVEKERALEHQDAKPDNIGMTEVKNIDKMISDSEENLIENSEKEDDEGSKLTSEKKSEETNKSMESAATVKQETKTENTELANVNVVGTVAVSENISFISMQKDLETTTDKNTVKDDDNKLGLQFENISEIISEVTNVCPTEHKIECSNVSSPESLLCVPDLIEYPRSMSEQGADSNNNTVIREYKSEDREAVLPTTPITPIESQTFTTGSLTPSELLLSSLDKSCVVKSDQRQTGPTDLKSKVLEVNKDMEGLRLSIERSLAELNAIEKTNENTEKQIVDQVKSFEDKKKTPELERIVNIDEKLVLPSPQSNTKAVENTANTGKEIVEQSNPFEIQKSNKLEKKIDENKQTFSEIQTEGEAVKQLALENASTGTQIQHDKSPTRKSNKGKGKGKCRSNKVPSQTNVQDEPKSTSCIAQSSTQEASNQNNSKTSKTSDKQQKDTEPKKEKTQNDGNKKQNECADFEPIENVEDAMTSSLDDINQTFEVIATDAENPAKADESAQSSSNVEGERKKEDEKINPVSQPKNLLGSPNIVVSSHKTDYKKERNKTPNSRQAKVKLKDSTPIDTTVAKKSSHSQTPSLFRPNGKSYKESVSLVSNGNEDYVYKYSFRKVYLPSACQICKTDLRKIRVPCSYCNMLFYCSTKHKDQDWSQHQALCFAVSTILHFKGERHLYADAKDVTGHNYRLLRMQMIVSCEKILKRKLEPWEQELLLYPRICAEASCREWDQTKLVDCDGCGQIAYCSEFPDHLPKTHQRWCKSYDLYRRLVCYQQTKGRLEPKLPTGVMKSTYRVPEKINEILADMYQEKIDMDDMRYASLTQIATAPLTALLTYQLYNDKRGTGENGLVKNDFNIDVVGAELQFEADVLVKWETFLMHLKPEVQVLKVSMISPELNPSNLPLDLLADVKLCEHCQLNQRRLVFCFQDRKTYAEYSSSDDFVKPDVVCAFNPSIERSSAYNGKDIWPSTINSILNLKVPLLITSYTMGELLRDLKRIKNLSASETNILIEPSSNPFASVRPDRNFISDDEMPLLFKNHCFMVICGV